MTGSGGLYIVVTSNYVSRRRRTAFRLVCRPAEGCRRLAGGGRRARPRLPVPGSRPHLLPRHLRHAVLRARDARRARPDAAGQRWPSGCSSTRARRAGSSATLVKKGYVEQRADADDGRATALQATGERTTALHAHHRRPGRAAEAAAAGSRARRPRGCGQGDPRTRASGAIRVSDRECLSKLPACAAHRSWRRRSCG